MKKIVLTFLMIIQAFLLYAKDDEFNTERLPIGNPKTKYSFCSIQLEKIFDTNSGKVITKDQFIEKIIPFRIIMVGENHTADYHHQVQLNIIKGLVQAGRSVCIALEMFTSKQNQPLNDYVSGKISEDEFLDQSDYFNVWGHNYRYYKPIFDYAREHNLRMYGINISHKFASKIGRGGIKSLTDEERATIPRLDTTNVEHRFFIKAAMEGMDAIMPKQFNNIYNAQSLWDAAMGNGAIKTAHENPESNVVLLAGSGHVAYNLGIGRIIEQRSNLPFASVVCVDIPDTVQESVMMKIKKTIKKEENQIDKTQKQAPKMPLQTMIHGGTSPIAHKIVIRSLADFLWGVAEEKETKYPAFGFSIDEKSEKGFIVKRVIPETIAEQQGILKGDIIKSIDGKQFANMGLLKKYISFKNWGESISFKILREEKEIEIEFGIKSDSK